MARVRAEWTAEVKFVMVWERRTRKREREREISVNELVKGNF